MPQVTPQMRPVSLQDAFGSSQQPVTSTGSVRSRSEAVDLFSKMTANATTPIDSSQREKIIQQLMNGAKVDVPWVKDTGHQLVPVSVQRAFGKPSILHEPEKQSFLSSLGDQAEDFAKATGQSALNLAGGVVQLADKVLDLPEKAANYKFIQPQKMSPEEVKISNSLGFGSGGMPEDPRYFDENGKPVSSLQPEGTYYWPSMDARSHGQYLKDQDQYKKEHPMENASRPGLGAYFDSVTGMHGFSELKSPIANAIQHSAVTNTAFDTVNGVGLFMNRGVKARFQKDLVDSIIKSNKILSSPDQYSKPAIDAATKIHDYYQQLISQKNKSIGESIGDIYQQAKNDPSGAAAGLINTLSAAPLMMAGGKLLGDLHKVESGGLLMKASVRAGAGAFEGATINEAISKLEQSQDLEDIPAEHDDKATLAIGAAIGGPLGLILGKSARAKDALKKGATPDGATIRDPSSLLKEAAEGDNILESAVAGDATIPTDVRDRINSMLGIKSKADQAKFIKAYRKQVKDAFSNESEYADYLQFKADETAARHEQYLKEQEELAKQQSTEAQKERESDAAYQQKAEQEQADRVANFGKAEQARATQEQAAAAQAKADALKEAQTQRYEDLAQDAPAVKRLQNSLRRFNSRLPPSQRGVVDPEFLKKLAIGVGITGAAATVGATLAPKGSKGKGAFAGAMFLPIGVLMRRDPELRTAFDNAKIGAFKSAVKLEQALGYSPEVMDKIWENTGFYKEPSGQWVFEIPDTFEHRGQDVIDKIDSIERSRTSGAGHRLGMRLSRVLSQHTELLRNVPGLKDWGLFINKDIPSDIGGYVDRKNKRIVLSPLDTFTGNASFKGTFWHEVQHVVQAETGMPGGTAARTIKAANPDFTDRQADIIYFTKDGEVMARNTGRRAEMPSEILRKTSPHRTADVLRHNIVSDIHGNPAASTLESLSPEDRKYWEGIAESRDVPPEEDTNVPRRRDFRTVGRVKNSPSVNFPGSTRDIYPNATVAEGAVPALINRARRLAKEGKSETEIWKATGLIKGKFGWYKNSPIKVGPYTGIGSIPDEAKVIEVAKTGNEQAIATLYNAYIRPMTFFVKGKMGNLVNLIGQDPKDIAHQGLSRALMHIDQFNPSEGLSFKNWVYKVTKYTTYNMAKEAQRRLKLEKDYKGPLANELPLFKSSGPETPGSAREGHIIEGGDESALSDEAAKITAGEDTPEAAAVRDETFSAIKNAYKKLPPQMREVYRRAEILRQPYSYIAKRLNISEPLVGKNVERARRKMADAVKEPSPPMKIPKGQSGAIDSKLLGSLGLLSAGVIYGIWKNPKEKILGAAFGAVLGLGVLIFKHGAKDTKLRISDQLDAYDYAMMQHTRELAKLTRTITKLVPNKDRRVAITHWLDGDHSVPLTEAEYQAAMLAANFFKTFKTLGLNANVLKDFVEQYVPHIWKLNEKAHKILNSIAQTSPITGMTKSMFALHRSIPTLAEGKALGLTPRTEDIASIISIYGKSMSRAVENSYLLTALKDTKDVSGNSIVMSSMKAPLAYRSLNHPQLVGMRVNPEILDQLKFVFDAPNENEYYAALRGLNTTIKRMSVSLSLFHVKTLFDAALGSFSNPFKAIKEFGTSAAGKNFYLKQLKEGGAGDLTDRALKAGVKISMNGGELADEDIGGNFYNSLNDFEDRLDKIGIGKLRGGIPVKAFKTLNRAVDKLTWENLHTGLKLSIFAEKANILTRNIRRWEDAHPDAPKTSQDAIDKMAASAANDFFGGLDWRRIADEATTVWGRRIANAILSPAGRRINQLLIFAPDWTLATTRSVLKAFGKGSGIKGILRPRTLADLHRQYIIRSALAYYIIGNTINYYFTGHGLFQNKDPTYIDLGDGNKMQWSKHTMETVHLISNPRKYALNKMGLLPRQALTQVMGVKYLPTDGDAPRLKTLSDRLQHLGKVFVPITYQNADLSEIISSSLGVPIYNKKGHAKASSARGRIPDRDRTSIPGRGRH